MLRLAPKLALSLALVAAQAAIGADAQTAPTPPVATTQFDYYVMTLSWAPGFCDLGGQETSSPECAAGSGDGFVVHGLWPDNEYRPNPEACLGHEATPDDLAEEHGVYPNDRLAAYEYRKHGTCTGLSAHDYFATVRNVRTRLNIPAMFQAPSERQQLAPEEWSRPSWRRTPICIPTIWRSAAATANSSTCASAWRRTCRLTPCAGRSRATPANADRSWLLRCVEQVARTGCAEARRRRRLLRLTRSGVRSRSFHLGQRPTSSSNGVVGPATSGAQGGINRLPPTLVKNPCEVCSE